MTPAVFRTASVHPGRNRLRPRVVFLGSRPGSGPCFHHPESVTGLYHVLLEARGRQLQGTEGSWIWSQETRSCSGSGTNFITVNKSLKLSVLVFSIVKGGEERQNSSFLWLLVALKPTELENLHVPSRCPHAAVMCYVTMVGPHV